MAFARQTWALCRKTLTVVFLRHWLGTTIRAFLAPVIFMFFISYAKNFFVPPSDFGIGQPNQIRSLSRALGESSREKLLFVQNGHTSGPVLDVIDQVAGIARQSGKTVEMLDSDPELLAACPSSIRGVSNCFGAVSFHSTPANGSGVWNYTLRFDSALGGRIFVNSETNDAEIYMLPLQHAIDSAIASTSGVTLTDNVTQYPYTTQTAKQRADEINHDYMGAIIDILGVAYFLGVVGVCYQLTGEVAKEREIGLAQLIEAMMPNRKRWQPQAARLLSVHIAFDILYVPSWILMGLIVAGLNYNLSNPGVLVGYFVLVGLALSSWSVAIASLFRRAQLSGITVVLLSIALAIIAQVIPNRATGSVLALSLLFPPMNFVLFVVTMAYWQKQREAVNLMDAAPDCPWQFPTYLFFVFVAIQILVYPVLGAMIERALYGTASKARHLQYNTQKPTETIKVKGLSKTYPPTWWQRHITRHFTKSPAQPVLAVNDIDLSVLPGQIMILLGSNGSGKTTTLEMLAGLRTPTAGEIEISASDGIGLCPQQNVLWDELTVFEHVQIFNRLKADTPDSKEAIKELVRACDLEQKTDYCSRTLSGGQKRKCQLAMMLTGGSKVCIVDEVSSGLDPVSRRKIWDILLAERGHRSILLTTHFLDEADLLSDDITIMSKGKVVANGSSVELKHRFGRGYRVGIYNENVRPLPADLNATAKETHRDQVVYQLANSTEAMQFVNKLEEVGVQDYQVHGPTIEDVFLKVAGDARDDAENEYNDRSVHTGVNALPLAATDHANNDDEIQLSPTGSFQRDKKNISLTTKQLAADGNSLQLSTGRNLSLPAQTWVLFRKRFTILRRNPWPYAAALLIPIIVAGLVTLYLKNVPPLSCQPTDQESTQVTFSLEGILSYRADIPYGPPSSIPQNLLQTDLAFLNKALHPFSSSEDFTNYIGTHFGNATPGGYFEGISPTFAWRGNYGMQYAMAIQNLLDVVLTKLPIATSFEELSTLWIPSTGDTLQLVTYFGLAMSAYPAFFSLYITMERLRNVRALHYSNGVRAGSLWLAYALFDAIVVIIVAIVAIVIFTSASSVWYGPGQLFAVFVLYGLSATLMSYLFSLITTSQLAAFAVSAGVQCVMFIVSFTTFMCIITYIEPAYINRDLNIANFTMGLFFPSANLLRAMLLSLNSFSLLCHGNNVASDPNDILVYGTPILYSILQIIAFSTILVWVDSGWRPNFWAKPKTGPRHSDVEGTEEVDSEVFTEVERTETSDDILRVLHLTKVFGRNVALADVSFGVGKGLTLSLLGPNGGGKSTTASIIRGDLRPSNREGDVLIENISITRHRASARKHLGVCPQFDAIDQMTAEEHLQFYAKVRGVRDVNHNIEQVMAAVGLTPFRRRMASTLSGGNKRKLSLAIALMGNPSVLILDEPSSGLDALSKRDLWRTLGAVASDRAMVLTTHSMEEADALADRAVILARRVLAIGQADELRKKHSNFFFVHVVHKDAPHTSEENMEKIKIFVRQTFPGASTEDRAFHGQLRFSVPNRSIPRNADGPPSSSDEKTEGQDEKKEALTSVRESRASGISSLFSSLEANKEMLGLEYYSVSQATLDQVFLAIVGKHNVIEENYAREHKAHEGWWTRFKHKLGGDTWTVLFKF